GKVSLFPRMDPYTGHDLPRVARVHVAEPDLPAAGVALGVPAHDLERLDLRAEVEADRHVARHDRRRALELVREHLGELPRVIDEVVAAAAEVGDVGEEILVVVEAEADGGDGEARAGERAEAPPE